MTASRSPFRVPADPAGVSAVLIGHIVTPGGFPRSRPAPQLLLLDEPTNNLDMASVRQLSGALRSHQGALIVASHDVPFLRELGLTRWLRLEGTLTEIGPL